MPAIILPQRWLRQPTYPVEVNRGSEIVAAMGITEVWSPLAGALTTQTNYRKATPILAGSALAKDGIGRGLQFTTSSTGNSLQIAADGDDLFGSTECSILLLRRSADTTARASIAFGYEQVGVSRVLSHAPFSDGILYWDYGNATLASGRISVAFTKSTTPEVLTFIASATGASPRGREVWRNRTLIASNVTPQATRAATTSAFTLGSAAGTASDIETQYLFISAAVAWPAALIEELANNPWQIFRKYQRRIYFEPFITTTQATIAGTESADVGAIVAANWTTAQVAGTESADVGAIATEVTTGAAIAGTESADRGALVVMGVLGASIAGVESGDRGAIIVVVTTGASIAGVETSDRGAINKPAAVAFTFVRRRYGLLLYEPLPLRTSAALGDFAEEFVLAHRFGDLTSGRFKIDRLNDTTFFVAYHPMSVANVFVDDQKAANWEQRLQSDGEGNTWTVVVFAAPVPAEARVSATGTGKRNPRTGALTENPADIAEDIMRIAGRDDRWWDQLRAEAGEASIRLAGSIDSVTSIRAALDAVLGSCGAIWAPGVARLYPVGTPSGYIGLLDKMKVSNLVASANLDNTADVLRLYYDPDVGKRQHYIEVTANPKRYGGLPTERVFNWLRSPSNAESVAKRVLPWLAGERYDLTFDCSDDTIRPGQWRRIVGHPEWPFDGPDPVVMILSAVVKPKTRTIECFGQTVLSSPAAIVTAHSVALPTTRDAGVDLAIVGGIGTFTFNDSNGQPVFGGRASLDGGQAKRTDAQGRVTFPPQKPGPHLLAWQAPGKRAQTLTVLF